MPQDHSQPNQCAYSFTHTFASKPYDVYYADVLLKIYFDITSKQLLTQNIVILIFYFVISSMKRVYILRC